MKEKDKTLKTRFSAEIEAYGYKYSVKQALLAYTGVALLAVALGKLYQLKPVYILIVAVAGIIMVPFLIRNACKRKNEQKRFSDATIYMDQMLYAFLRKPKIRDALQDTLALFPEGNMHDAIERALAVHVESNEMDINQSSLAVIEEEYSNDRIKRMHNYFRKVEDIGRNYKTGIELQITDRSEWVEGICEHQVNIKKYKNRVMMSIILVLLVCGVPTLLINGMDSFAMSISDVAVYEIATVLYMIVELLIYLKADKKLSIDWLDEKSNKNYDMQEQYLRVVNYDAKKEMKKSFVYASIPAILFMIFCFRQSVIGMAVCAVITVFMLCQHTVGHKLSRKLVRREIEKQFPGWLMEIVLRLQTENVQVAIMKSEESAPAVLKEPVYQLVQELTERPESADPYMNFLKDFSVPEIQEAMKRFYSLSSKGIGDIDRQMMEIIGRSNGMMRKAEKIRHEDEEGGLYGLMLAPQIPVIFEFIVSFYAFLMIFFSAVSV